MNKNTGNAPHMKVENLTKSYGDAHILRGYRF